MQAVTAELLVVGAALETALLRRLRDRLPFSVGTEPPPAPRSPAQYRQLFEQLLHELGGDEAVDAMVRAVQLEEATYRAHGLVTYVADSILLDVLTDTTERSPTFMVPAFRKEGDADTPSSWAFVKDPYRNSEQAWREMLQREPRGLDWDRTAYRTLNAPESLQANPPGLSRAEIYRFRIGNEPDPSRTPASGSVLVLAGPVEEALSLKQATLASFGAGYTKTAAITLGARPQALAVDEQFHVPCHLTASPLRLWEHLAVKLVFNTLSTATMARMERVVGNAMAWLSPSNKKLIDRGSRLVSQLTGCRYEHACEILHEAMEETTRRAQAGEEVASPVALAIERIHSQEPGLHHEP